MKILIIVFIVIAIVASLSSLTYVTADIVVEKKNEKKEKNQPKPENDLNQSDAAQAAPAPENEVFPELVESVDAKKADELLSNSLALSTVQREKERESASWRSSISATSTGRSTEARWSRWPL